MAYRFRNYGYSYVLVAGTYCNIKTCGYDPELVGHRATEFRRRRADCWFTLPYGTLFWVQRTNTEGNYNPLNYALVTRLTVVRQRLAARGRTEIYPRQQQTLRLWNYLQVRSTNGGNHQGRRDRGRRRLSRGIRHEPPRRQFCIGAGTAAEIADPKLQRHRPYPRARSPWSCRPRRWELRCFHVLRRAVKAASAAVIIENLTVQAALSLHPGRAFGTGRYTLIGRIGLPERSDLRAPL